MGSRAQHSHGAPIDRPKPGQTTRKRPQVGDKDPNYKPPAAAPKRPKRPPSPKKPPDTAKRKKPDADPGYNRRDYRGVDGAVEDAEKGKKK